MFRIVYSGGALPASFPLDPSAQFQAGCIGEMAVIGNQILCTVSNGTAPLGIIDDFRTKAFTNISWNEEVIVPITGVLNTNTGQLVSPIEVQHPLKYPYILASSFTSTVNCSLNSTNGIVAFIAGTPLNIDLDGDGIPDGIRAIVNYTYQVNNIPGDDSTMGSGRVTIWYERIIFETDQYETNQQYALKSNLFVNEVGLLTTRQPSKIHPAVGMVLAPPTSRSNRLQALWY